MSGLVVSKKNEDEEAPKQEIMDPAHFDMICNPAYHAFKAGLEAFHKSPSNEILDDLHTILLMDNSQRHAQIQRLIPELYPYISRPELYSKLCLLFCDISHLNREICDSMMAFQMFDKLNYDSEASLSLVLSICDCNPAAWAIFAGRKVDSRILAHQKIQLLVSQFEK